ncbi:conserved membrane protein of unknown function [Xenorhabdus poinarii G6]|uniref:Sulfatase N-terminal domain-containing protein n=1 Tax=Xenorhabdus poinarii G6 TaxID=1354304 RepID=A0A068R096_9GAMM|nr:sulfatase-like hydrolase/transferase [Xenorhabdus poinarii]CDG20474.1 conserved membrane protein of unknown function [Xenorhabdus poinarii G6]
MINKIIDKIQNGKKYNVLILLALVSIIHHSFSFAFKPVYAVSTLCILVLINPYTFFYKAVILFLSICSAIYFPISSIYGSPNFNTILSLFYTNKTEAKEFLFNLPFRYLVISLIILATGYIASKFTISTPRPVKISALFVFILTTAYAPAKAYFSGKDITITSFEIRELRFFNEIIESINDTRKEIQRYESLSKEKDTFSTPLVDSRYNTYVLVIGESARRDFFHNYGFPINNTPFTSSVNGKFFTNYISAASSTQLSLTNSIAMNNKIANNIIALSRKAGFETYWLSNQGSIGFHDTPVAIIGKSSSYPYFLKKFDYDDKTLSDQLLLPKIEEAINSNSKKNKLIVVHIMGSHPPSCDRTNGEYDRFYKNKPLSCYIQSIKNTDALLAKIYNALKSKNDKWSMIYFSDHGLSFNKYKSTNDINLTHGDKYQQNYEVPFFVLSYNDTTRENYNNKRSALHFMSLFSQWTGIKEPSIENHVCDFISEQKCEDQDSIINFSNKKVMHSALPSDKHAVLD